MATKKNLNVIEILKDYRKQNHIKWSISEADRMKTKLIPKNKGNEQKAITHMVNTTNKTISINHLKCEQSTPMKRQIIRANF